VRLTLKIFFDTKSFHVSQFLGTTMTLGTLYILKDRSHPVLCEELVKHFKLDIKVSERDEVADASFPLKRVPTFIGVDGFKLSESIAVNLYCKW
jgi:elongation factor 1-gamma